jgi:hypothetical protein
MTWSITSWKVTANVEVSDPEFDGDVQAHDESLVLGDVVGGSKIKLDYIAHVDSKGRDEEQARTCSHFH